MNVKQIETALHELKGIEQILVHLSVSDYIVKSGGAEMFCLLRSRVAMAVECLERGMK